MNSSSRRRTRVGRWTPLALYAAVVLGWCAEGVSAGAGDRLWLVLWTLPAPILYVWRTREERP